MIGNLQVRAGFLTGFTICLSLLPAKLVFAWGHTGHQLIGQIAAELAPAGQSFWQANSEQISTLANVPDAVWKSSSTAKAEKPTHWFQIDAYASAPWQLPVFFNSYSEAVTQFGSDTIQTNGTASWRSQEFYSLAVDAMKQGDYAKTLQMAGVLAHYVGDLSQPLHVTVNYDGDGGSKTGIHAFFESSNVQNTNALNLQTAIKAKATKLLEDPEFIKSFNDTTLQVVYREIMRSADSIQKVLDVDQQLGRGDAGAKAQLSLATDRMADGAATLAIILGKIWIEGGRPDFKAKIKVTTPAWVAPQYKFTDALTFDDSMRSEVGVAADCDDRQ